MSEQISVLRLDSFFDTGLLCFNVFVFMWFQVSHGSVIVSESYSLVSDRAIIFLLDPTKYTFFTLGRCSKGTVLIFSRDFLFFITVSIARTTQISSSWRTLQRTEQGLRRSWNKAQPSNILESCHFKTYPLTFCLSADFTLVSSVMAIMWER